ncbi:MAG: hypothetical protein OEZ18_00695 [Candidatus Bathyarchaeota archaeon]|nr:hypothetical protein [Candidatus Bathyarchaeota archaeon]
MYGIMQGFILHFCPFIVNFPCYYLAFSPHHHIMFILGSARIDLTTKRHMSTMSLSTGLTSICETAARKIMISEFLSKV